MSASGKPHRLSLAWRVLIGLAIFAAIVLFLSQTLVPK
jgi:hypothetical protein